MEKDFSEKSICSKCVRHRRLKLWAKELGENGECAFCHTKSISVIPLYKLSDMIESLLPLYHESPDLQGELLFDLIQQDWEVFSDSFIDTLGAEKKYFIENLIYLQMSNKDASMSPDFTGFFHRHENDLINDFRNRVEQALKGNADIFHLKKDSFWKMDRITLLFKEAAETINTDEVFFRARIHKRNEDYREDYQNEPYETNDMNPPPPVKVEEGRINRKKEPVLYLGSDEKTTISEVRPWKHCAIAVSHFVLKKNIKVVDFSKKLKIVSPFFKENINWMVHFSEAINQLHLDFSTPVQPWDNGYIPTQLISSLIKEAGFDGIKYKSAMGEGYNIAVFKWDYFTISEPQYFDVKSITYEAIPRSDSFGPIYSYGYYEDL